MIQVISIVILVMLFSLGRSLANPSFALQLCLVEFENVNIEVGLTRGEDRFGKIFVEDMLQLAGVNGYKGMFCNAMGK